MREIKFRAWSTFGSPHMLNINNSNFSLKDLEEERHWKVMQFTGLTDKNGKEIYEGDYIQFTDLHGHEVNCTCEHCFRLGLGTIAEVRWMDDGFMLVNPKASKSQCACAAMGRLFSENHEVPVGFYAEVIGNIYENPDLIKE